MIIPQVTVVNKKVFQLRSTGIALFVSSYTRATSNQFKDKFIVLTASRLGLATQPRNNSTVASGCSFSRKTTRYYESQSRHGSIAVTCFLAKQRGHWKSLAKFRVSFGFWQLSMFFLITLSKLVLEYFFKFEFYKTRILSHKDIKNKNGRKLS